MTLEQPPGAKDKVKKLFDHCFEISRFDDGDSIPVGGKSVFSHEANIAINGDFENLNGFLQEAHEAAAHYNLPQLKEWLRSQGIEIDEKLFAVLFAFTKEFEKKYPDNSDRAADRKGLYKDSSEGLRLSDILDKNAAECAEIAALAQYFLQQESVTSSYFSGDVLRSKDQEFSEEHSFIIVRQGDRVYIFDPANPTNTTAGSFPSIYTTEANFDEEIAKGQKRFVTAKNILSKKEAFYGVGDGANVIAARHIV